MDSVKKLVDGVLELGVQINDQCDMSWCPACPAISVQSVKNMDELDHKPDCIYELAKKMKEEMDALICGNCQNMVLVGVTKSPLCIIDAKYIRVADSACSDFKNKTERV